MIGPECDKDVPDLADFRYHATLRQAWPQRSASLTSILNSPSPNFLNHARRKHTFGSHSRHQSLSFLRNHCTCCSSNTSPKTCTREGVQDLPLGPCFSSFAFDSSFTHAVIAQNPDEPSKKPTLQSYKIDLNQCGPMVSCPSSLTSFWCLIVFACRFWTRLLRSRMKLTLPSPSVAHVVRVSVARAP